MHQPCPRHAGVDEPIGVQLHCGLGVSIGVDVCAGFSCHGGCRLPCVPNAPRGRLFVSSPALAGAPWAPPLLGPTVPCARRSWVAVPRRCRQHPESVHDHTTLAASKASAAHRGAVSVELLAPQPAHSRPQTVVLFAHGMLFPFALPAPSATPCGACTQHPRADL